MEWQQHYNLKEKHAFLSPSSYHWINYDEAKLESVWMNNLQKEKGTMLHAFASVAIKEGLKLAKLKKALNLFVNDAIGFGMESEQVLYYSDNCFGTADAIKYIEEEDLLMIHDLKTGVSRPSFNQLYIYCALFCLEYGKDPYKTTMCCRLYQGSDFKEVVAEPDMVAMIMDKIVTFDAQLDNFKNL